MAATCAICLDPLSTPCKLRSCGHVLDCHCLLKVLARLGGQPASCPLCRKPFTIRDLDEQKLNSIHAPGVSERKPRLTDRQRNQYLAAFVIVGVMYGGLRGAVITIMMLALLLGATALLAEFHASRRLRAASASVQQVQASLQELVASVPDGGRDPAIRQAVRNVHERVFEGQLRGHQVATLIMVVFLLLSAMFSAVFSCHSVLFPWQNPQSIRDTAQWLVDSTEQGPEVQRPVRAE